MDFLFVVLGFFLHTNMIVQTLGCNLILVLEMTRYPGTIVDALNGNIIVLCLYKFIDNCLQLLSVHFKRPKAYIHFVRLKTQMWIEDQRCGQIIILGQFTGRHARRLGETANSAAIATIKTATNTSTSIAASTSTSSSRAMGC